MWESEERAGRVQCLREANEIDQRSVAWVFDPMRKVHAAMISDIEHPLFVPEFIGRSRLMSIGGFMIAEELTASRIYRSLAAESRRCEGAAQRSTLLVPNGVDVRGGSPEHCLGTTGGGEALTEFYRSQELR